MYTYYSIKKRCRFNISTNRKDNPNELKVCAVKSYGWRKTVQLEVVCTKHVVFHLKCGVEAFILLGVVLITTVSCGPSVNLPPEKPYNPFPENGATNMDGYKLKLSWSARDPNFFDTLRYDVYFGESPSNLELIASKISNSYVELGGKYELLLKNKKYYWRVVVWDSKNEYAEGDVWEFTTAPNYLPRLSESPTPSNGATNVPVNPVLRWDAFDPDGDALTFDLQFGEFSPPPLIASGLTVKEYRPGTLKYGTKYYWKLVVKDSKGARVEGPIWSFTTEVPLGEIKWKYRTSGYPSSRIISSPAIGSDGTIYVGGLDTLYAIRPNGTLKWWYTVDGQILSSPAVRSDWTGETVYFGSTDGILYAVDDDGNLKWRFKTDGPIESSPAVDFSGNVYVGSADGYLYAIRPDGTIKWGFKTDGAIYSSPAIGLDGTIYVGSEDGSLYAVGSDGTERWRFITGGGIYASPAIASDGTIYVGSRNNYLYAIYSWGTLRWKMPIRFKSSFITQSPYSSPVVGADGTIYVGDMDGYLWAITSYGTVKWSYKTGGPILSTPTLGNHGTVYFGSGDGYIYALRPDGSLKWRSTFYVTGGIRSSATLAADGTMYVGGLDGWLYAIYTDSFGLATLNWPKFRGNIRNTGRYGESY